MKQVRCFRIARETPVGLGFVQVAFTPRPPPPTPCRYHEVLVPLNVFIALMSTLMVALVETLCGRAILSSILQVLSAPSLTGVARV